MRLFGKDKKQQPAKEEKKQDVAPKAESKPEEKKATKKAVTHSTTMPGILLYPLVTEKGTRLQQQDVYQFAVATGANKIQIKQAVKARYGVMPRKVRVMHRKGKVVRFGRYTGTRKDWKRALVTLPKGKTIDVHEGV